MYPRSDRPCCAWERSILRAQAGAGRFPLRGRSLPCAEVIFVFSCAGAVPAALCARKLRRKRPPLCVRAVCGSRCARQEGTCSRARQGQLQLQDTIRARWQEEPLMRTAGTASAHSAQQGPLLFVFTGLWYTQTANHDADTSLYSLTFRLCVFIPESERKWRGIIRHRGRRARPRRAGGR